MDKAPKTLAMSCLSDFTIKNNLSDSYPASKNDQLVSIFCEKKPPLKIKIDFHKPVESELDYYSLLIRAGFLIQQKKLRIPLMNMAQTLQKHLQSSKISNQIPPSYSKTFNLEDSITTFVHATCSNFILYCAIKAFFIAVDSRYFQRKDLEALRSRINELTSRINDGEKKSNPFRLENLFEGVQSKSILDPIHHEEPIKIISSNEDFKKWFDQNAAVINDWYSPSLVVANTFFDMAVPNNFSLLEIIKRVTSLNTGYFSSSGVVYYPRKVTDNLWEHVRSQDPVSCLFDLNWYCKQDRSVQYDLKDHCMYLLKNLPSAVQCIKLQPESFRLLLEKISEDETYYERGLREAYRGIILSTLPTNLASFSLACDDEFATTATFSYFIEDILLKDNQVTMKNFDMIINIMSICESSKIKRYDEQQASVQIIKLLEAKRYYQEDYKSIVQTISRRDESMFQGIKKLIYEQIIDSLIKNTRDSGFFASLFGYFSSGSQKNSEFFKSDLFQKAIEGLESPFNTLSDRDNKFIELMRILKRMPGSDFQKNMILAMKERLNKEVFLKIEKKEIDFIFAEKLLNNTQLQANLLEYRKLCEFKEMGFFEPIKQTVKKLLDFKNHSPTFLSKFANCEFLPKHFRDKQLEAVKSKQNYISVMLPFVEIATSYPNISKVLEMEATSGLSKWLKTKIDQAQSEERAANPAYESRMSMKQMDELVGIELVEISNYILKASQTLDSKTYDELNTILASRIENLAEISKLCVQADKQVQKNLQLNIRLYRVRQNIKKSESLLTSFHQFCKLLNPDMPTFDWDLSKLRIDEAASQISIDASHRQAFSEERLIFLEQVEEETSTLRSVINLQKLMEEFKSKTSQHFFSLEDAAELEDDSFKILLRESIELLINLRNTFSEYVKLNNLELIVRKVFSEGSIKKLGLATLESQSEKLISLSKIAVDTGNEYKSEIEHIMDNTTIEFVRPKRGAFKVEFKYAKNQRAAEMKLEDLESLYAQLKWRENIGGAHNNPFKFQVEFLKVVLENTKKALEYLESMRSRGYINNLEVLMKLELKRLFETTFSYSVEFPSETNPLSVRLQKVGENPQLDTITKVTSDIIRVREVLGSCLDYTKDEERILFSNKDAKWIQFLKPIQREILCEYFIQMQKQMDPSEELKDEVVSIFRYWFECVDLEISLIENLNSELPPVEALPTTLALLSKVKVPDLDSFIEEQIHEPERDFTKWRIKFTGYKENKYSFLFQLVKHINLIDFDALYPKQFFFCNDSTSTLEISAYLKNAFLDSKRKSYFLMDVHLLSPSMQTFVQDTVHHELNLKRSQPNLNIYFIFDERSNNNLSDEYCKLERLFEQIQVPYQAKEDILQSDEFLAYVSMFSLTVVHSKHAGLGKTHWIRKTVAETGGNLLEICLFGESSNEALDGRMQILREKLTKEQSEPYTHLLIKLDMMDNMAKKFEVFDQIIFQLAFLKCIPHCGSYIFSNQIIYIYVEVGNNYQSYILKNLPLISLCQQVSDNITDVVHSIQTLPEPGEYDFDGVRQLQAIITFHCLELISNGMIGQATALDYEQWEFVNEVVTKRDIEQAEEWALNFFHILPTLEGLNFPTVMGRLVKKLVHFDQKNQHFATMDHLINFIEILFTQFMKIGLNPTMNPVNYLDFIKNIEYLFQELYQRIFAVSKDLIWSKTIKLREEAQNNKRLLEIQQGKKSIAESDLTQFNYVESSWDHNLQASFIFATDSLRVFYRNLQLVSNNVKVFIKAVAGETLRDLSNLKADNQGILVEEIVKSLSFVSDQNSPYLVELKEYDKLPAENQKLKKEPYLIGLIKEEIIKFENGKGFNLNYDNYLKMMLIYQRVSLGIPVILMGATGCGKTYLLKFLSENLLREKLLHMTLHAGTKESELEELMIDAMITANSPEALKRRVWVFFDEFNTSPLQALIVEMVFSRRANFSLTLEKLLNGKAIPENIIFVMACNPFRLKKSLRGAGLINESINTMLSHRVYPIPERILSLIWDFGNLSDDVEKMYIASMVESCQILKDMQFEKEILISVAECISICHQFLRKNEDNSSVSLRDLDRFDTILTFHIEKRHQASVKAVNLVESLVCTIFLCYFMRLESEATRDSLNKLLALPLKTLLTLNNLPATPATTSFVQTFQTISNNFIQNVKSSGKMHRGVAINRAVRENLYAMMIAILSKVPLIICGKPGTSKTLSTQIIIEYLNSDSTGPRVEYVVFSGSQVTTSESIQKVFDNANKKAEAHKRSARGAIVVVLFDEMGLAEIGYNNPLKVLHPILEPKERTVSFIGISNWKLDLSKMSRAMYVARPDPGEADLLKCVNDITDSLKVDDRLTKLKEVLAKRLADVVKAYIKFISNEQMPLDPSLIGKQYHHPCFFGQRDFFHLLKFIDRYACFILDSIRERGLTEGDSGKCINEFIFNAIDRNFSGKNSYSSSKKAWLPSEEVYKSIYCDISKTDSRGGQKLRFSVIEMINQNLIDAGSRHLMIFTQNQTVTEMMNSELKQFFINKMKYKEEQIKIITKTLGSKDATEVVQALPGYIESGCVLILRDTDEIYSCLYEVLNQKYFALSEDSDELNCRLHFGDDKAPKVVKIHKRFRVIVLMDASEKTYKDTENRHPAPFLNRCEKYLVQENDLLNKEQAEVKSKLEAQIKEISEESCFADFPPHTLIHNCSQELIYSLTIAEMTDIKTKDGFFQDEHTVHMNDYLNRLIGQFASEADNDMVDAEVAPAEGESEEEQMDQTEFLNSAFKRLYRLFSRNMILFSWLATELNPFSELGEIHSNIATFNEKHKIQSFEQLLEYANPSNQDNNRFKFAVFTLSQPTELDVLLSRLDRKNLLECEDFLKFNVLKREEEIKTLVFRGSNLIIRFRGRKEWENIRLVRGILDELKITAEHRVILVAHYLYEDLRYLQEVQTSLSFLSESNGWELLTIDDLTGCDYDWFYEIIRLPLDKAVQNCYSQNDQDNPKTRGILNQMVLDYIDNLMENPRPNWALNYLKKDLRLIEAVRDYVVAQITLQLERDPETRAGALSMRIYNDSFYKNLLQKHPDSMFAVRSILQDSIKPHLIELLDFIDITLGYDEIKEANRYPEELKAVIIERWQSKIINFVRQTKLDQKPQNILKQNQRGSKIKVNLSILKSISTEFEEAPKLADELGWEFLGLGGGDEKALEDFSEKSRKFEKLLAQSIEEAESLGLVSRENLNSEMDVANKVITIREELQKELRKVSKSENKQVLLDSMVFIYLKKDQTVTLQKVAVVYLILNHVYCIPFEQANESWIGLIGEERSSSLLKNFEKHLTIDYNELVKYGLKLDKQRLIRFDDVASKLNELKALIDRLKSSLENNASISSIVDPYSILAKSLEILVKNPELSANFRSVREAYTDCILPNGVIDLRVAKFISRLFLEEAELRDKFKPDLISFSNLLSSTYRMLFSGTVFKRDKEFVLAFVINYIKQVRLFRWKNRRVREDIFGLLSGDASVLLDSFNDEHQSILQEILSSMHLSYINKAKEFISPEDTYASREFAVQRGALTIETIKALEEECQKLLTTNTSKLEETKSALFEAARIQKSVHTIIEDKSAAIEQMDEAGMEAAESHDLQFITALDTYFAALQDAGKESSVLYPFKRMVVLVPKEALSKAGFVQLLARKDLIVQQEAEREAQEKLALSAVNNCLAFLKGYKNTLSHLNTVILVAFELTATLMSCFNDKHLEKDLTALQVKDFFDSELVDEEKVRFINSRAAEAFKKFQGVWATETIQAILNEHPDPAFKLTYNKKAMFQTRELQDQAVLLLGSPKVSFANFLFDGKDGRVLPALLSELLEVNETMKLALLEFCNIKLPQAEIATCSLKEATSPDDFIGFLEDDLNELLTLDDIRDKELVELILSFLLSEKNLKKRVDYLNNHELFRYSDSERESLLQLVDKCFGEKLSNRTAEQTGRLFDKLAARTLTEQGIKKLERAFYILMNNEDKFSEASLRNPIASLNDKLAALASEELILKDVTVEELKDLLVYLGSAKFDLQQLSKQTSFEDDNLHLTELVVNKASVVCDKLNSMPQRESELMDKHIRINGHKMKALLASRPAHQLQIVTTDLHRPALDLIVEAANLGKNLESEEATLAKCSDVFRLVQMTSAYIELNK